MAQFFGKLMSAASAVLTKSGTKTSGLQAELTGRTGGIRVELYSGADGRDRAQVRLIAGKDGGRSPRVIYDGPVDPKYVTVEGFTAEPSSVPLKLIGTDDRDLAQQRLGQIAPSVG